MENQTQNKLVIFDGNALMYRAFHALPPLTTTAGEQINAVYGLVSMLLNVVENLRPSHIIFTFDEKERTFRQDLLPTYQSQRPETPPDLIPQFEKTRNFLKTVNIPIYSKSGFEADDVIGTLCKLVCDKNTNIDETIVVTGDRDILQLVDDSKKVRLFMPIAGLSNGKIFGENETMERMGVYPNLIPDYKALVGDPSDNYFGISGIGPKTAIKLLSDYKSLSGIYEQINDIPERLREKLINGKSSAELSYKLATIVKDVPVKFDINDANNWNLISTEVIDLFEKYGFKTLTSRIKLLAKKIEDEKQGSLF